MKTQAFALLAVILAAPVACDPRPPGFQQGDKAVHEVLGHLRGRDQTITFYASGQQGGPRFRVSSSGGAVLADGLSFAELAERYPALGRAYQSAFARRAPAAVLDASFHAPPAEAPERGAAPQRW